MKRWLALLLLCAGTAALLSACGESDQSEAMKSADKTADYLSGNKSVEQGRKMARCGRCLGDIGGLYPVHSEEG